MTDQKINYIEAKSDDFCKLLSPIIVDGVTITEEGEYKIGDKVYRVTDGFDTELYRLSAEFAEAQHELDSLSKVDKNLAFDLHRELFDCIGSVLAKIYTRFKGPLEG